MYMQAGIGRKAFRDCAKYRTEEVFAAPTDSKPHMLIQRQAILDFPLFIDVPGSLRNVMQSPFKLVC